MLARTTGKEEDEAIRHLFQRLAILLVKGNAASWYRIPSLAYCEWRIVNYGALSLSLSLFI
jgi:hypothetical protein